MEPGEIFESFHWNNQQDFQGVLAPPQTSASLTALWDRQTAS